MQFLHWTDIRDKVQQDLDLKDEGFIEETELLGYVNEAIDDVEAEIHTIFADYFLSKATISLVTGTDEYALPSDIYATKIRRLLYNNGSVKYEIRRIKDISETMYYQENDDYGYLLTNVAGTGYRIKLYPPSRETTNTEIWYLRNANRLTISDTDTSNVCDIPEFVNYVIQHTKMRCYEKEMHPNAPKAVADADRLKNLMRSTLTDMVPDEDNEIIKDLDFYYDFDNDTYFNI